MWSFDHVASAGRSADADSRFCVLVLGVTAGRAVDDAISPLGWWSIVPSA